jgi:dUTPase
MDEIEITLDDEWLEEDTLPSKYRASMPPRAIPIYRFAVREGLDSKFVPNQADVEATGWDVRCAEPEGIKFHSPFQHEKIRLGIRMFAPKGWWLELRPRSSTHAKKHLHCLYGVIDETYENELMFSCQFIPPQMYRSQLEVAFGERIGQIIPIRKQLMVAAEVSNEEFDKLCKKRGGARGTGGFGST